MPVPISTTARASSTEARNRSAAPPPEPIATTPDLLGARAGGGEDVVLGDEGLGVGPARGLDRGGDGGLLVGRRRRTAGDVSSGTTVSRAGGNTGPPRSLAASSSQRAERDPHRVLSARSLA